MKNIATKLLKVQQEIGSVTKDSVNPFFSSKYIQINSLLTAVNPILQRHGVLLSQPLTHVEGKLAVTTMLVDADSGELISETAVISETKDAQKAGAAISYFRRYGVLSILGLGAVDDDVQSLSKSPTKSAAKTTTKSNKFM